MRYILGAIAAIMFALPCLAQSQSGIKVDSKESAVSNNENKASISIRGNTIVIDDKSCNSKKGKNALSQFADLKSSKQSGLVADECEEE